MIRDDPAAGLVYLCAVIAALLAGITVHEFSHAWAATSLGDRTARGLGRLSLNPVRHLDPMGSALLLLAGFGWGKPVPVNPAYLRGGARPGMALVSLAGPASNLAAAVAFGLALRMGAADSLPTFWVLGVEGATVAEIALRLLVRVNLILAVLNLIPIAPLDGFKVALGLLPPNAARSFGRLEPYGPIILLGLIVIEYLPGDFGILSNALWPAVNALAHVIVGYSL